ncbi:MAG: hypothetical protein Q4D96_09265 [Propionibacteriaceae bacterium]|nr:hypothetical protein [Propionibacteriaceae bacterium]
MSGASWRLTAVLSPRLSVRVAGVDASGRALNVYSGRCRVDAEEPGRPWAVYLAGSDHRFRLLCFDLDAKSAEARDAAVRDADILCGLLHDVGLDVVVCESGPTGGRHVWTGLVESVDAETVATLARLARHLCPTVDVSPLTNPVTGCVRPPGAPHRAGGHSTVISGELSTLTAPTGTAAQVRHLVETLAQLVTHTDPPVLPGRDRPLPVDDHGRLYLPGPRRNLPAASAAALQEKVTGNTDASAVVWRVLIGAAAARWRHHDIAQLVETAPGLEHIRTYRDGTHRRPRSPREASLLLRRQWDKAVTHVATTPRQIGDDPTFDTRADAIATHIRDVQARADASTGRWTTRGGPTDRKLLDALCILALQALTPTIEADIRRLALLTGIGRETARTALHRLAADGWITQVQEATGPHGAHWKITPSPVLHSPASIARSQADPRPEGAGTAERHTLLATLTGRLADAAHDLFTPSPGLGHHAGNLYALTTLQSQRLDELAHQLGSSPEHTARTLDRLVDVGVLIRTRAGWKRPPTDRRTTAAQVLGIDGRLNQRAHRYQVERELWAWWRSEEAWMRAPRRPSTTHRPSRSQLTLLPDTGPPTHGPHPRRPDGRLNWKEARRIIETEHHITPAVQAA